MKHIFVVILLFWIIAFSASYSTGKTQDSPPEKEEKSKQEPSTVNFYNNDFPSQHQESANYQVPQWYKSAEWWLVIAAFITLLFLAREAHEMASAIKVMKRSTKATEDMYTLQHTAIEQGIIVNEWTSRLSRDNHSLRIGFRIRNPTRLPLTVKTGLIHLGMETAGRNRLCYSLSDEYQILPDIPKTIYLDFEVTDEDRKFFLGNEGVSFDVSGNIQHTSAGPAVLIGFPIRGKLWCNKLNTVFEEEAMTAQVLSSRNPNEDTVS